MNRFISQSWLKTKSADINLIMRISQFIKWGIIAIYGVVAVDAIAQVPIVGAVKITTGV